MKLELTRLTNPISLQKNQLKMNNSDSFSRFNIKGSRSIEVQMIPEREKYRNQDIIT